MSRLRKKLRWKSANCGLNQVEKEVVKFEVALVGVVVVGILVAKSSATYLDNHIAIHQMCPTAHHHPLSITILNVLDGFQQEIEVGEAGCAIGVCEEDEGTARMKDALGQHQLRLSWAKVDTATRPCCLALRMLRFWGGGR